MEKFVPVTEKTQKTQKFNVLIAAAGQGTRCGAGVPKQYRIIAGKPLLRHTLEAFIGMSGLQQIRVIIDPSHADWYHEAVKGLDLPDFIAGSDTRKKSIYNGLTGFSYLKDEDFILIHDAARPLIQRNDTQRVLAALEEGHQAVTLAIPVADTLKYEKSGAAVTRDNLYALQTPQGFHYGIIKKAHEQASPDIEYTDDTGLVAARGVPVKLVQGHKSNFKVTTEDDFDMARVLLEQTETRTGMGFDVHAFAKTKGKSVILCGVSVPHGHTLEGHSDADVGLHALTDALLGSISAGDIGTHFPPSNDDYKNMDSMVFLDKAVKLITEKGGHIVNLDVTLICEAPKIGPHREAMECRIAEIANIAASRVSVKATTTEKLGFTGRGEGIAAQAIATVRLPRE